MSRINRPYANPILGQRDSPADATVESSATILGAPFSAVDARAVSVMISNEDVSQTVNGWIETSPAGSLYWEAKTSWQGLDSIGPGTARNESFTCETEGWLRVMAQASGAGSVPVKVLIQKHT